MISSIPKNEYLHLDGYNSVIQSQFMYQKQILLFAMVHT